MPAQGSQRSDFFPAIEKKHGQPMSYWFDQMKEISDLKYAEQISYLRENHGFSQAHANALVLYSKGSTSAHKFKNLDQYLKGLDETKRATVINILKAITDKYPTIEQVIAWNQPMLKWDGHYVFGISVSKNHITVAPFNAEILDQFSERLEPYHVNKKTFRVPVDWKVDQKLLRDMIAAQIKSL